MALVFNSTVPKFRLSFAYNTKQITVTDLLQSYSAYDSPTLVLLSLKDPDNIVFYQNTGFSLLDFDAPDFNSATPTWAITKSLPLDADGNVKTGLYTVSAIYKVGTTIVTITKTHNLQYVSPVVSIDITDNCRTSQLISTDATEYDVNIGGVEVSPAYFSRTHKITKPDGSGANDPGTVTDTGNAPTRTIGGGGTAQTDLWTRVWQTNIATTLMYNIEDWGTYHWVQVTDVVTGYDFRDVECTDLPCVLRRCWENLVTRWDNAKSNGSRNVGDLEYKKNLGDSLWIEFYNRERCGVDTTPICNQLKELLASEDCSCDNNADDSSTRVVAYGGGTTSGGTNTFVFGNGSTEPSGGHVGDLYWQIVIGPPQHKYLWSNTSSGWVNLGDFQGEPGEQGNPGTTSGSSNVLFNAAGTGTSAGTSAQTLASYSLIPGILVNDGDFVEANALLYTTNNDNGKSMEIDFGGTRTISYFTDSHSINTVRLRTLIRRLGVNSQGIEASWQNNVGGNMVGGMSASCNLTDTNVIAVVGTNSVASANDIICDHFRVVLFSKITGSPVILGGYDAGVKSLSANTPTPVVFASPMPDTNYTFSLTAVDAYGSTQQVTVTNILSTGFTVETMVATTLYWSVNHI